MLVTSSRSMVNGPASIAEHGQAGVTPSSCVCSAAWLSGLAVCWPRRPPNRVCVLHGGTPMRGRRLVCVRIPLQHSPPQHRNLAVVGASKKCASGHHTTTTLHATSTNRTCALHPHEAIQPHCHAAFPRTWDAARCAPAVRIRARTPHHVRHTLIIGCVRLCACVCA